jgi:hypothetical protein
VAHRAYEHDRLCCADGQVQEIGELFERVGPRRDDGAGQSFVRFEYFIDAPGQLHPLIKRHRGAGNVRELLGFRLSVLLQPRNEVEHLLGAQPCAASRCDGTARRDEPDSGQLVVGPNFHGAARTNQQGGNHERENGWFYEAMKHARAWSSSYYTVLA